MSDFDDFFELDDGESPSEPPQKQEKKEKEKPEESEPQQSSDADDELSEFGAFFSDEEGGEDKPESSPQSDASDAPAFEPTNELDLSQADDDEDAFQLSGQAAVDDDLGSEAGSQTEDIDPLDDLLTSEDSPADAVAHQGGGQAASDLPSGLDLDMADEDSVAPTEAADAEATVQEAVGGSGGGGDDFDDLFDDFLGEEGAAPAQEAAAPEPKKQAPTSDSDDAFDDLGDLGDLGADMPTSEPAQSKPQAKVGLDDLFAEEAQGAEQIDEDFEGEDLMGEGGAEAEAVEPKKRLKLPLKRIGQGSIGLGVIFALTVLGMGRFSSKGFLGWKWGQAEEGEYQKPSASELRALHKKFENAEALELEDKFSSYSRAKNELAEILRRDKRFSPAHGKMAEMIILSKEHRLDQGSIKTVEKLLKEGEAYESSRPVYMRAKARFAYAQGSTQKAFTIIDNALKLSDTNPFHHILKGELLFVMGSWEEAMASFERALELDDRLLRAKFFLGRAKLASGAVDEAADIFESLIADPIQHQGSYIEKARLEYERRADAASARETLKALFEMEAGLSSLTRAKAHRMVAEIDLSEQNKEGAISNLRTAVKLDPLNHHNFAMLGKLLMEKGIWEEAGNSFQSASNLSPEDHRYLTQLGICLKMQGKYPEALAALEKSIEKSPSDELTILEMGRVLYLMGRTEEAFERAETILDMNPKNVDGLVLLGKIELSRHEIPKARAAFEEAISFTSLNWEAYLGLGKALFLSRRAEESIEHLKKAYELQPTSEEAIVAYARSLSKVGRADEAAAIVDPALEADPSSHGLKIAKGHVLLHKEDFSAVQALVEPMIAENERDFEARILLGRTYLDQDAYRQAVTELREGIKYKTDHFEGLLYLGMAWRGVGELESALDILKQAEKLRPDSAVVQYEIEKTYIYRNNPSKAKVAMEKALKRDPTYSMPLISLGAFYLSQNYYKEAIEYFNRAEDVDPGSADTSLKLAEAHRHHANFESAKKYYKLATRGKPYASRAYIGLGMIAEEENKPKLALGYYHRARKLDKNNPRPYYYLGFLYRQVGDKRKSIYFLEKYLELNPTSIEKVDILDQIALMKRK